MGLQIIALTMHLLWPISAAAVSESPFAGYFHTGWMPSDGAPGDIHGIVQDAEGWLWIASSTGLYRFDGHAFERVDAIDGNRLHKSNILSLAYLDGALWVGYGVGGIERFKGGVATFFDEPAGLPKASVHTIVQAPGGPVTAATAAGLYEWRGAKWMRTWPAPGQPRAGLHYAIVGVDGALLISAGGSVLRRRKGEAAFAPVPSDSAEMGALFPGPNGQFWTSSATGLRRHDPVSDRMVAGSAKLATNNDTTLFVERDGTLWMDAPGGLQLLEDAKDFHVVDTMTRARGLSDGTVQFFFQDREDNVWIGTSSGIDRLRRTKVHTVTLPLGTSLPSVAPDNDGRLWVSSRSGQPLRRLDANGATVEYRTMSSVETVIRGADGTIWAANREYVARYVHGKETIWPMPAPVTRQPQSMAQDSDGSLWLSVIGSRVLRRLRDGQWKDAQAWTAYPDTVLSLHVDTLHRVWQGFADNRLAVSDGKLVTRYTAKHGLQVGNVLSVSTRNGRAWVGGDQGLMLLRDGRFVAVVDSDGKPFTVISAIVETADGDLWLHGSQGITHIRADAIRRLLAGGERRVPIERMNYEDGILGQAPPLRPLPSLTEGPDGRLWYVTRSSAGWIAPRALRRNTLAPPVTLRTMTTGGMTYAPNAATAWRLPPRSSSLRLDYTALTLTMPERIRFRYRLAGADDNWVDAGNRRSAFYTNLSPGDYRFEVQAANEDGVWNTAGALQRFTIAPTIVQTGWFRALCGGAILAGLWLLCRWRLHQLSQRMRLRMDERLDERARIARELHDTLLQSVHGLVLKVHGASMRLPEQEPVRDLLDDALTQAETTIADGRNRVQDLRTQDDGRHLLPLLKDMGDAWAHDNAKRFTVHVEHEQRLLTPGVGTELLAVCREAMSNAFRHAHASHVAVTVQFRRRALMVNVSDDGGGITDDILANGGRRGHFGLVGMQERAARLGGTMTVQRRPEGGTECVLVLPAALAYAKVGRRWWL